MNKKLTYKVLGTEKEKLVEGLGVYLEQEKQIPPLAARIVAMLIINGNQGTTFEQLVADLGASKSTICTHLNALTTHGQVIYLTKTGDRKRYYAMAPGYIAFKIKALLNQWHREIGLQKQIISFKNDFNKLNQKQSLPPDVHQEILEFLSDWVSYFENQNKKYHKINKTKK